MGRTARLAATVTSPEHGEACLLCAKIEWLGDRVRRFHKHIAKAERALYARWWRKGSTLITDYKMCQRDVDKWTEASPRILQELERRQKRLKARQGQWNKRRGRILVWLKQHSKSVQPVADKNARLRNRVNLYQALITKTHKNLERLRADLKHYNNIIRREGAKYVEENFPLPIHLAWDKRLNRVLTQWQENHPLCVWCGLRFGGFHVGQPNYLESGERICQFCKKETLTSTVRMRNIWEEAW